MAARPRDLPETQTCSWCGYLALGRWHDGEMFVCSHCWEMHGGKMPDAIEEPESAPQPTPTADAPPDAGVQQGAASGSDVPDGLLPWLLAVADYARQQ